MENLILQSSKELLTNLILRIDQISNLSDDVELKERFLFLLEDIQVLLDGIGSLEIDVDYNEMQYVLNQILNNMEKNEYYLIKDLLIFELSPLLQHWGDIVENEDQA